MTTPALSLRNLTLGYDRSPAIRQLDVDIDPGSLTAVVGPNGGGKSTLLKGIMGFLTPLGGQIICDASLREGIAYLPQQSDIDRLFPITVHDLVAMGLWRKIGSFRGLTRSQRRCVEQAVASVGMSGSIHRTIGSLSGGQLHRVLFARLRLQDAKLILLDEPFAAVDTKTALDLVRLVKRWHAEGKTILVVLHDIEMVRACFPDTLALARDLVAYGPTAQVLTSENLSFARRMCEDPEDSPIDSDLTFSLFGKGK